MVDVRLWRGKYNFEARVRWRGLDPATGEEWEPTWLHAKSLDRAAKEEAWALQTAKGRKRGWGLLLTRPQGGKRQRARTEGEA